MQVKQPAVRKMKLVRTLLALLVLTSPVLSKKTEYEKEEGVLVLNKNNYAKESR